MGKDEIKEKLLEIVEEELPEVTADEIDTSASIVEEYDVDSVSLIRVIVDAEKVFGVQFDDHELALNKYDNFDAVIDVIEDKLK